MLPYDRKRAFRKQWLYLGTFLTVIFLTVTNLEMVAEVLRSGRKLGAGWTESYILKVLTGDGIRLYFPLLCTVPYATGFVDEYKSGIYKFVLVRKERKKYIISKAITNAIAGGSILVAGTVAFILCTWIVFLPMEKGFSWRIIQNFLGKYGQMLCQFFAFGALEAEIGMWISTLVNHRYMAWLAPFMSEYLLIPDDVLYLCSAVTVCIGTNVFADVFYTVEGAAGRGYQCIDVQCIWAFAESG